MQVEIGWGREPRVVEVPPSARVLVGPPPPASHSWTVTVEAALTAPVGAAALDELLVGVRTAVVLVPDETRKDVARRLLPVLGPHLDRARIRWSVGVATGKHAPQPGPPGAWVHDARDPDLVLVGHTAHGTEVRYPRAVVEADLRILVGEIRPHYFAGYAGGAKMLFPGVAGEAGIWHNHTLKAAPGARLGQVDHNPCRADLEAAAALVGPSFIVNIVRARDGGLHGAVAGEPVAAHRAGVALARPVFEVSAPAPAAAVLVSDRTPVTMDLYQACKLLPPAGAVLRPGGTVILAAACEAGIGPVEVINEAIYRLGVIHALPPDHRVILVSGRSPEEVAPTFCEYAPDLPAALARIPADDLLVLPFGGDLVPVPGRA